VIKAQKNPVILDAMHKRPLFYPIVVLRAGILHRTVYFYSHTIALLPLNTLNPLQTSEIDNLIVSWEQSSWLCCAGFTLLLGEDAPAIFLAPLSGVS
jgi:hypothetical protein